MKSISTAAMDAIEAGEAIVTGALELYSRGSEPIEIPAGTDIVLGWQQTGATTGQGRAGFAYLDADGVQIGATVWSTMMSTAVGSWTPRSVSGTSPALAVTLRIFQEYQRSAGVTADQGMDAFSLSVGGETATLTNPGAETGDTTGWTTPVFSPLEVTDIAWGIAPYAGDHFFAGGANIYVSAQQDVSLSEFAPVDPVPPVAIARIWGGYGPIELDGETYQGIGDRGLVQQTAGAIGGVAQGLTLTLSGIEPEVLTLLDDVDLIKGGAAVMRRLIFASDGKTLLDYDVWDRGRIDTVETEETIGGGAAIKVAVESAARGLGRSGARQRADSDQRLIDANDGYFKFVAYAGEKMLYWGGRRPSRAGSGNGGTFQSFTTTALNR